MRPSLDLWRPTLADADGSDAFEILDQRGWSRDLSRTSPIARSGINRWREYVVGSGLGLQSVIDASELGLSDEQVREWQNKAEKRFNMWAGSKFASVEGDLNFFEMQQVCEESKQSSGDVFALITQKRRDGWPFRLSIQLIEADRVCNPQGRANSSTLFEGIERGEDGEIIKIHVANHHPGSLTQNANKTWEAIPVYNSEGRRNILHWKRTRRPGQSRGMPLPSIIGATIKQVGRWMDAEVDAAVLSAAQTLVAEMDYQSFDDLFNDNEKQQYITQGLQARQNSSGIQSGQIINTLPGEKITSPTPGRPNPNAPAAFDLFLKLCAMGLNEPEEILVGKFTTSYTAAQAAFQQWHQSVKIERDDLIWNFCQPIYEIFLEDCVIDGVLSAPGFLSDPFIRHAYCGSQWNGSGRFVLNPLQEAKAAELRAQFLTTEATEAQAYDGGDYTTRHEQRVREAQNRREGNLPPLGETAPPSAAPQQDGSDDDGDDDNDSPPEDSPGGNPLP